MKIAKEWLGIAALAGLTVFLLAVSWRKWPDPLVDFSRELYVPWRLANGAVLYRDVEDIFGPLSQSLNAGLFALFGPGLMVLVAANLAVFAAILAAIYLLFRRAWGPGPALIAAGLFVAVFGFSQFTGIGNYNYATPYCHEATHGFLVCLLLVAALWRWTEQATVSRGAWAGLLLGLTAVLKPEFMLIGGLVTAAAVAVQRCQGRPLHFPEVAAWAGAAALPTAGFTIWFSRAMPWRAAFASAGRAWINVVSTGRFTGELVQRSFLGFDHPRRRLEAQTAATLLALAAIAGIAGTAWLADRSQRSGRKFLLAALAVAAALWLGCRGIDWLESGRCFLGLVVLYLFASVFSLRRSLSGPDASAAVLRLLIAVLAAALMGRMVLNGRLYHYGFYQAALAGILIPAFLLGELPARLRLGACGRAVVVGTTLLLLVPGAAILVNRSQALLRAKTEAVGTGRDLFYAFPPAILGTGDVVRVTGEWLGRLPPGQTLVVLPEGEMINYLARMPSSVAPFVFYAATTSHGREEAIVAELQRHPPDWIALVSRDLRDYGIPVYGDKPGEGLEILDWVRDHYEAAMTVGGSPLDPQACGGIVLQHRR